MKLGVILAFLLISNQVKAYSILSCDEVFVNNTRYTHNIHEITNIDQLIHFARETKSQSSSYAPANLSSDDFLGLYQVTLKIISDSVSTYEWSQLPPQNKLVVFDLLFTLLAKSHAVLLGNSEVNNLLEATLIAASQIGSFEIIRVQGSPPEILDAKDKIERLINLWRR